MQLLLYPGKIKTKGFLTQEGRWEVQSLAPAVVAVVVSQQR